VLNALVAAADEDVVHGLIAVAFPTRSSPRHVCKRLWCMTASFAGNSWQRSIVFEPLGYLPPDLTLYG
jgi:hypothetical protein